MPRTRSALRAGLGAGTSARCGFNVRETLVAIHADRSPRDSYRSCLASGPLPPDCILITPCNKADRYNTGRVMVRGRTFRRSATHPGTASGALERHQRGRRHHPRACRRPPEHAQRYWITLAGLPGSPDQGPRPSVASAKPLCAPGSRSDLAMTLERTGCQFDRPVHSIRQKVRHRPAAAMGCPAGVPRFPGVRAGCVSIHPARGAGVVAEFKLGEMFDDDRDTAGKLPPVLPGQPFDLLGQIVPIEGSQQIGGLILAIQNGAPDRAQGRRLAYRPSVQILLIQTGLHPIVRHGAP